MKKLIFIVTMLLAGFGLAFSQDEDPAKREKMFREFQEFKMNYLAREMDLSEAQKKKFIEVYEDMTKSRLECFKEAKEKERKLKRDTNASEEEYKEASEALAKANAKWSDEEKAYNEKFSEFLTQKQIFKMREAENNFKSKMQEMKHSRKKDRHKKVVNK